MAVPTTLLNARLLKAERPVRTGTGGDIVGTPAVLYEAAAGATEFDIIYEPTNRLVRAVDGRDRVVNTELFVNFGVVDVWIPGDLVTYVDQVGRTHERGEVFQADTEGAPNLESTHWRLVVIGV